MRNKKKAALSRGQEAFASSKLNHHQLMLQTRAICFLRRSRWNPMKCLSKCYSWRMKTYNTWWKEATPRRERMENWHKLKENQIWKSYWEKRERRSRQTCRSRSPMPRSWRTSEILEIPETQWDIDHKAREVIKPSLRFIISPNSQAMKAAVAPPSQASLRIAYYHRLSHKAVRSSSSTNWFSKISYLRPATPWRAWMTTQNSLFWWLVTSSQTMRTTCFKAKPENAFKASSCRMPLDKWARMTRRSYLSRSNAPRLITRSTLTNSKSSAAISRWISCSRCSFKDPLLKAWEMEKWAQSHYFRSQEPTSSLIASSWASWSRHRIWTGRSRMSISPELRTLSQSIEPSSSKSIWRNK